MPFGFFSLELRQTLRTSVQDELDPGVRQPGWKVIIK